MLVFGICGKTVRQSRSVFSPLSLFCASTQISAHFLAMVAFIFFVTTLIAVAHFIDFLLGRRGQRLLKDRLIAFYLHVSEQPWSSAFLRLPAATFHAYMLWLFGAPGSLRFFKRVFLYSVTFSVLINVLYDISYPHQALLNEFLHYPDLLLVSVLERTGILLTSYLADLASFAALAYALRLMGNSTGPYLALSSAVAVAAMLAVALGGVVLGRFVGGLGIEYDTALDIHQFVYNVRNSWSYRFRRDGIASTVLSSINPRSRLFLLNGQVLVPAIAVVVICVATWLLVISERITKPILLLLLERLEDASVGVCTAVASAASALLGVIAAFRDWGP